MKKLVVTLFVLLLIQLTSCSSISRKYRVNLDVNVCSFEDELGQIYCPIKDIVLSQDDIKNDFVVLPLEDLNELIESLPDECH